MTKLTLNQQQNDKRPGCITFTTFILCVIYFFNLVITIYIFRNEKIYIIILMFILMMFIVNPAICGILVLLSFCIKVNSLESNNDNQIV